MASGSNNLTSYQANILAVGRTFKVALGSTNASTAFNGSADITDIGVDGTLSVANGGTGSATTPTQWGVIYANTASSYASTAVGGAGYPLIGKGSAAPEFYAGLTLSGTTTNDYNATFGGKATFTNGHIYLKGTASSSTSTATQIIFTTSDSTEQVRISATTSKAIVILPDAGSTGYINLKPNGSSAFTGNSTLTIGTTAQTDYTFYVNGTQYINDEVYININTNKVGLNNTGALIIGNKEGVNLAFDNNEIQTRDKSNNDYIASNLGINQHGGDVNIGAHNTTGNNAITYTNKLYILYQTAASSTSTGALVVDGGVGIAKKLYANGIYSPGGSIWAGTFAINTAQSSEYDIGVQGGAGKIYFYSDAAVDGYRGIFAKNVVDDDAAIITLNQNNRICDFAPLVTGFDIYNNNIARGTNPAAQTDKSIVFRSEDTSGERKQLARIMNSYSTSGINGLELIVYAPSSGTVDTELGLQMFAAVDSNDDAYSYSVLKGCLTIEPNQSNYREGLRIKSYGNWATITLRGADNTAAYGTSANTWSIGNSGGNLYITRNGNNDTNKVNLSSVDNYWRIHGEYAAVTEGKLRSILHIYGSTYGDAADIQNSNAGYMTYGDGGPQITFDTNSVPGNGQTGALLFTDNENAGTGASFHFLSNQSDWNVISKRFHARTSITIRDAAAPTATAISTDTTYISAGQIDLASATPYIDFHHANDTNDYTSRLISEASGLKLLTKSGVNTWLYLGNGTDEAGLGWTTFNGGWYMNDTNYMRFFNNKQLLISSSHATSSTNLSSQMIVSSVTDGSNLDNTTGSAVAIELWRGANASWQIVNDGGYLYFKNNWTTAKQSTYSQSAISVKYGSGETTIGGQLTVNNLIKSTYNSNTVTIGSQNGNFTHIYNSANIPFIFNKGVYTTSGDLGSTDYPWNNLYIGKSNGAGIYYAGTKSTQRMIRFIDNTADAYGNGVAIGGGGLTMIGSGESCDTVLTGLNLISSGGTETTYITSDGDINFYPNNGSYDASALCKITASKFWAGVNGNTTREAQVGAQSGAGQIYLYSQAATAGGRGLYIPAHGTGSAKSVISVDTNNNITLQGAYADVNGTKRELQFRYGARSCDHNTEYSVTFSPAFSNTCLTVFTYCEHLGFDAYSTVSCGSKSKTGFKIHQYNNMSASMNIEWVAIGY